MTNVFFDATESPRQEAVDYLRQAKCCQRRRGPAGSHDSGMYGDVGAARSVGPVVFRHGKQDEGRIEPWFAPGGSFRPWR